MNIYIIVKQFFYVSRGIHYQCADDNPVVMVYKSVDEAKRACDRLTQSWIQRHPDVKLKTSAPSSEFVAKYGLFVGDNCEISYNIIKESLI